MRNVLLWLVQNVPLGKLAPYILGLAVGSNPRRKKTKCFYCLKEGNNNEATTTRNGYPACDECYESIDAVRGIYHLE